MHIEVGFRRMGKTTRLMRKLVDVHNAAKFHGDKNYLIILMGMSVFSLKRLAAYYNICLDNHFVVVSSAKTLSDNLRGQLNKTIHLFVDEFDNSSEFKRFVRGEGHFYPDVIRNGYFSSTQSKVDSVVSELLDYVAED